MKTFKKAIVHCMCWSFVLAYTSLNAQIKFGDNKTSINAGSLLELESTTAPYKGLLLTRISLSTTATWGLGGSGVAGMQVYNTNASITSSNTSYPILIGGVGMYYWDGSGWVGMKTNTGQFWSLTGNSGTNSGTNFLGTTDNSALKFRVNNIMAGYIDSSVTSGNTFWGNSAGLVTLGSTGTANTFLGSQAGQANTTGSRNVFSGYQAGYANTTGGNNFFGGYRSGYNSTTGSYNAFAGMFAGFSNTSGAQNTYVGYASGYYVTTGSNNSAFGQGALSATGGLGPVANNDNTAIGSYALFAATSGNQNTAVGSNAGVGIANGGDNVAVGFKAMYGSNGDKNVVIGSTAGGSPGNTYTNNTLIGYGTNTSGSLTNATALGYNAQVGQSNSLILGGTGANAVSVGIGTTVPTSTLQVVGSLATNITTVGTTYTVASTDYTVLFAGQTAAFTTTLPDPTTCKGRILVFANYGTQTTAANNNVTLSTPSGNIFYRISGNTVSSATTFILGSGGNTSGGAATTTGFAFVWKIMLQSNGTNWYVIGNEP